MLLVLARSYPEVMVRMCFGIIVLVHLFRHQPRFEFHERRVWHFEYAHIAKCSLRPLTIVYINKCGSIWMTNMQNRIAYQELKTRTCYSHILQSISSNHCLKYIYSLLWCNVVSFGWIKSDTANDISIPVTIDETEHGNEKYLLAQVSSMFCQVEYYCNERLCANFLRTVQPDMRS